MIGTIAAPTEPPVSSPAARASSRNSAARCVEPAHPLGLGVQDAQRLQRRRGQPAAPCRPNRRTPAPLLRDSRSDRLARRCSRRTRQRLAQRAHPDVDLAAGRRRNARRCRGRAAPSTPSACASSTISQAPMAPRHARQRPAGRARRRPCCNGLRSPSARARGATRASPSSRSAASSIVMGEGTRRAPDSSAPWTMLLWISASCRIRSSRPEQMADDGDVGGVAADEGDAVLGAVQSRQRLLRARDGSAARPRPAGSPRPRCRSDRSPPWPPRRCADRRSGRDNCRRRN